MALAPHSVSVPVFRHLDVDNYGLFPGADNAGVRLDFRPGLTLVLGANGLGKSTLVLLLYRLLTGPFEITGLAETRELGTRSLEPVRMSTYLRGVFARRVADGARLARAQLTIGLDGRELLITRRLSDLGLVGCQVDGQVAASDEAEFQSLICQLAGLSSFGDWLLMLRHLVFYFEERRALVWDPSAQRQVLRLLFLPEGLAAEWTAKEREILQLDSHMRNLAAALTREERSMTQFEARVRSESSVRQELAILEQLQADDEAAHVEMDSELVELNRSREGARLRRLQAEQAREAAYRELERAKLLALGAAFPTSSDTARYVLAQLLAGDECLVCGNVVPEVAERLSTQIAANRCVICDSSIHADESIADLDAERVPHAAERLSEASLESAMAETLSGDAERAYEAHIQAFTELGARIGERAQRIELLLAELPPDEASVRARRSQLSTLRSRVEEIRVELTHKRAVFGRFIESANRTVVERSQAIVDSFQNYARGFLLEESALVWSPHRARVGQTGEEISYPSFDLSLTGSDFPSPVRRTGPEEVSESQREFIDLAFRMALMDEASAGGRGTLVIDAPESSLDAVFTGRAASVLARFAAATPDNRLVLTSNLVEGALIPTLLRMTNGEGPDRIVDLLEIAEPTAAVREMRGEYARVRDLLVGSA